MYHDLKNVVLITVGVISFYIAVEIIYHFFKVKSEYTRKAIHIVSGFVTLLYPIIFENHWPVLAINIETIILMSVTKHFNVFKSLNEVDRVTWGSYLYPVSIYLLFVSYLYFDSNIYFYIPVLILVISDPVAALSGLLYKNLSEKHSNIKYVRIIGTSKTIVGSFFFFFSALLISLIILYFEVNAFKVIYLSIIIAVISSIVEAYSSKGLDNFTIPMSVLLVLIIV